MQPLYRSVLSDSWKLCRTKFFIWPLAFFASLIGIAGTFQIFFDLSNVNASPSLTLAGFFARTDFITTIFVGWSQAFDTIPWARLTLGDLPIVLFFFFLLLLVVAFAVIVISSEGGLIYALNQLQRRKNTSFLASFRQGLDKFWQVFSITLIYQLLRLIVLGLLILPLIFVALQANPTRTLLISLLIYLILIPVIVVLDLVARYSIIFIMLRNNTIMESFLNAWLLFRTNWVISIETAVLILVVLIISFLILSIVIIPLLMIFFTIFGSILAFSSTALQLATIITITTFIAVIALFVTIFTALQMSLWVGVFRKITTGQHHSKLHRLSHHLPLLHKRII